MKHQTLPIAPTLGDRVLSLRFTRPAYSLRLAVNRADLQEAQKLRFAVFNVELKQGLVSSHLTGLDADPFDAACDHLLVVEVSSGRIIGTYRLQTGRQAARKFGYYSEQEFDFSPFEPVRGELIELGRACVHRQHRNLGVLGLLWNGIADYARSRRCRYLIGCSSLASQCPAEGAAVYRHLRQRHLTAPRFQTLPLPAQACPLGGPSEAAPPVPRLMAAYLSLGAKICGPPAIDREFKTIDFLTFIDLAALSGRTIECFRAHERA